MQEGGCLEFLKNNWIKVPILHYVLGFVVHNTYLSNFRSYEFELIEAKYIQSGFGVVAFSAICLAYISIKVNLSYISNSFNVDKLFPWLLRVTSFPYVIYLVLYSDSFVELFRDDNILAKIVALTFIVASFAVFFSIIDLIFMYSEGEKLSSKIFRNLFRILSIPMILITSIISLNISKFSSILKVSTYFFFGFVGLGLKQKDRRLGVGHYYPDSNTEKIYQNICTIFFGIIAISFILWAIISNYVKAIYHRVPVAICGTKIEHVEIQSKDIIIYDNLIQESNKWILYINNGSGNVEKLKSKLVDKIIYTEAIK